MSHGTDIPVTQAVRFLRENNIPFEGHLYRYEEHGGTAVAAAALNAPEHAVIKTLVMEDERGRGMIVLMHGDREVSTKDLARFLGVKTVVPSDPGQAMRRTGYIVGGTSPFGTRTDLTVYAEATIFLMPRVFINGGKRGFLVSIDPAEIRRVLPVTEVSVGIIPTQGGHAS
ncbi:MAG TPA: YbaK/EbsC family protein [Bacteroidota bacterium]